MMLSSISKHDMTDVSNVLFYDETFLSEVRSSHEKFEYLEFLALCHTVMMDDGHYNAASPDELALINFAKMCGVEYAGTSDDNEIVLKVFGEERRYQLLDIMEFNSKRKRMSVVVRDEEGKVWMLTKGADNMIIDRSKITQMGDVFGEMMGYLNKFAVEGLRTLLLSKREMSEEEYTLYKSKMVDARSLLVGRKEAVEIVEEQYEVGLRIIGATAIEDRLQDQISETIFVRNCYIIG